MLAFTACIRRRLAGGGLQLCPEPHRLGDGDCNGNRRLDECETIDSSDFDVDGDVDLDDFAAFLGCLAGPDVLPAPHVPDCAAACLSAFDRDGDDDIDVHDAAGFTLMFTGG